MTFITSGVLTVLGVDLGSLPDAKAPQLTLFKSNTSPDKGSALCLRYSHAIRSVFVELAGQKGTTM